MNNKKYFGIRNISNFLPEEVKKLLKKRGFFQLELLKNWEEIIGPKYSKYTLPIKVKLTNNQNGENSSTLIMKVDPSIGFGVQHDMNKIMQKINSFFGYEAVTKITIIQDQFEKKIESNNNNDLKSNIKKQTKTYNKLDAYPELKKNFEKIAEKIIKN